VLAEPREISTDEVADGARWIGETTLQSRNPMTARLLLSASLLFTPTLHALAQYHMADTIVRLAFEEADFNQNGVEDKLMLFHDMNASNSQLWIWDTAGQSLELECGRLGDDSWGSIFGPADFKNDLDTSDARLVVRSPDNFLIIMRNPQMRSYEYESWNIRHEDGHYWIIGYEYAHRYHSIWGEFETTELSVNLLTRQAEGGSSYTVNVFDEEAEGGHTDLTTANVMGPYRLQTKDRLPRGTDWWRTATRTPRN